MFNEEVTEVFPDLDDSDQPEATLALHQSPNGTMFWMAGQEGIILRVGAPVICLSQEEADAGGLCV